MRNRARCKLCGDTIESKFRHDFVKCRCGEIFVDGGVDYLRYGYLTDADNFIRLGDEDGDEQETAPAGSP